MRVLKNTKTGGIFLWTEALSKHPDMREIPWPESEPVATNIPNDADPISDGDGDGDDGSVGDDGAPEGEQATMTPEQIRAHIDSLTEKSDLDKLAKANGIDLDLRKSVKTLQAQLTDALLSGRG